VQTPLGSQDLHEEALGLRQMASGKVLITSLTNVAVDNPVERILEL
jgi:hypothetical protein